MLKALPGHLGIWFLLQMYVKEATDTFSLCVLEAWVAKNDIKRIIMFAHQLICVAFHIGIWNTLTEKFKYKSSNKIYLCKKWITIITWANWIKLFMTFNKLFNSDDACAKLNRLYFRAKHPTSLCSIKTEATIRTKWSNSVICSGKDLKFIHLRRNGNLTVLNMGYKYDLLQPKQDVFWHLTYSRSETINAWKIPPEVMKLVYLHTTYALSVLIIGLNITCTKFWILWICPRPTS